MEVSFCIPVFNSGKNIERCLQGVLAQAVPSREILVVDNCSTDDTVARARQILEGVPGARLVVNDRNIGRIENWNRCLELAEGTYIRYAMANDQLLPGSTEMLLRQARGRPEVTMVCSRLRMEDNPTAMPAPVAANPPAETYDAAGALQRLGQRGNDTGGLNGLLINGDAVRKHNLRFDPKIPFYADYKFAIELAERGAVVYLAAESYLFDNSIKGRFSHAGLQNRSYYFEARECALFLGARLPAHGLESWQAFAFVYEQYTGHSFNYGLEPLSLRDTAKLFEGAGPYLAKAMQFRRAYAVAGPLNLLKRLGAKLGLYRFPWQQS